MERDTEAPLQFVAQIDAPPTHDPMHRGVGAGGWRIGGVVLTPAVYTLR